MTVAELIEELKKMPQDVPVFRDDKRKPVEINSVTAERAVVMSWGKDGEISTQTAPYVVLSNVRHTEKCPALWQLV